MKSAFLAATLATCLFIPAFAADLPPSLVNSIGMQLVRIPPGEFVMGSPETEPGRKSNETQHKVKISRGFMMGVTCVTQRQWKDVMGTTVAQLRDKADPHWILVGEGDDVPIYYMTWDAAVEFCKQLSEKEGRHYRLPTEAEWEYACRAGAIGAYAGSGDVDDMAWYADNSGDRRIDSVAIFNANKENYDRQIFGNHCHVHPVARKKSNAWGLYDMHGNLFEWCSDYFADYPTGEATDPKGPSKTETSEHVLRGGSFYAFARRCRSADRDFFPSELPERRFIGFRVCQD